MELESGDLTNGLKSSKIFKSPKSLVVKSPNFQDAFSNLLFSPKSTGVKTPYFENHENEDDNITGDQIMVEMVDIIVNEEKNYFYYGFFLLFSCVVCWVLSVQILNVVMKDTNFDNPYLAAYFNGSFFILFGLKSLISEFLNLIKKNSSSSNEVTEESLDEDCSKFEFNTPKVQLSKQQLLKISFFASILYFSCCFFGSAALKYTSASNQTILTTSSSVFSLIIGILLRVEKFSVSKIVSVCCSLFGICLISFSSTDHVSLLSANEQFGDVLAVTGAFCYSCFLTLIRKKLGEQTNTDNDSLFYGFMGLLTIIFGYIAMVVLKVLNLCQFELPENKWIVVFLLLSSFLNSLSDYFGALASLILSPLSVSLSLTTAIPISMILDSYFYDSSSFSLKYFIGIVLILSAFVFTNLSEETEIINSAIENAIDEAINFDEQLTVYLSPDLRPSMSSPLLTPHETIPTLSIDNAFNDDGDVHRLIVTGGQNHKYFLREIKE